MSYPGQGGNTYGGAPPGAYGNQGYGNQGNQGYSNQGYGNQGYGNQGNQGYNNQGYNSHGGNQGYGNQGYNNQGNNQGYNNQGNNQGYNQGGNHGYNQGGNQGYDNYGPPQGPPPGQYGGYNGGGNYQPPHGPPSDRDNYGRPPQGSSQNRPNQFNMPPQGQQSFGNNAQGYKFQYSNCSGKKKALLIGINYFNSKNALRGCINDVRNLQRYLIQNAGYNQNDMVILTDDQRDQRSIPTKQNIIQACQWLVKDARPNDSLVFHFSGHGGQEKDRSGDEDDGYDECIYPVDFQRAGSIIDDILHDILVKPLPQGCRLTALFDSCHSGTALDLPYVYSTKGVLKEPNLAKEAGQGLLGAVSSYARGDIGGALSSIMGTVKQATTGSGANERAKQTKTAPCDAISISGCKDSQTSADAMEGGTATGAMSFAFIEVMTRDPNQSYLSLLNNMREVLRGKYSQKPQLSASHPMDMNLRFVM